MRKRESGFTLIELLIVIAIIGILAAIAIPNLLNAVQRGKQKRTMSDMRALATAVEAYAVDNNVYPAATCNPGLFTNGTYAAADDGLVHEPHPDLHRAAPEDRRLGPLHALRDRCDVEQLQHQVLRARQHGRHALLRNDDELQRRHHLLRRHVRSVAGRHPVLSLDANPDSKRPRAIGAVLFGPRESATGLSATAKECQRFPWDLASFRRMNGSQILDKINSLNGLPMETALARALR